MASPPLSMYPMLQHQHLMTEIECPTDHDVKSGRGVSTNSHPGNERFRSLVNCNKELYVTSTKRQKMAISRSIVEAVRSLDPPGGFLEKDPETGLWSDIGDKKAIEKTSQALRDGAAALRKQLSADFGDPDFLNAVFDPEKNSTKTPEARKERETKAKGKLGKGKPPAKGHRRVRSNPTVGTATKTKALQKKARCGEVPLSPKQRSGGMNLPIIPRPIQSPISPESDRASPGIYTETRSESYQASRHQRYHSPPSFGYGLPPRSSSFDYHDMENRVHYIPRHPGAPQSPISYEQQRGGPPPSPRGHQLPPPHPRSPRSHHMSPQNAGPISPLQPGSHHMSPSGYYQGPPSPTLSWSPRQFNHGASPHKGPSFSPRPHMHPSDISPFRFPEYRSTLQQRAHHPAPVSLSVPTLGGERDYHVLSPPSPSWHNRSSYYPPGMPRNHNHVLHRPSQHGYQEFMPPPPPPPRPERSSPNFHGYGPGRHRVMSPAQFQETDKFHERQNESQEPFDEEHQDQNISTSESYSEHWGPQVTSFGPSPSPTKNDLFQKFDSPSAVADVARAESPVDLDRAVLSPIQQKESRDSDDYPFDEDNPAADDISVSPLPFDDDPASFFDLPDNILQLPISPCGPLDNDDSQ